MYTIHPEVENRLEQIFDSSKGTPESDEADILALLVQDYHLTGKY
jgi:hypothetical protein